MGGVSAYLKPALLLDVLSAVQVQSFIPALELYVWPSLMMAEQCSVISEQPFLFVARTIFLAVLKNSFKICLLTKNAASIVRSRWVVMVVLL